MRILGWLNLLSMVATIIAAALLLALPFQFPSDLSLARGVPTSTWLVAQAQSRSEIPLPPGHYLPNDILNAMTLAKLEVNGCFHDARMPIKITCIEGNRLYIPPYMHMAIVGLLSCMGILLVSALCWHALGLRRLRRTLGKGYRPPRLLSWPWRRAYWYQGLLPYWPHLSIRQRALLVAQYAMLTASLTFLYGYEQYLTRLSSALNGSWN